MRHFLAFISVIFLGLFLLVLNRQQSRSVDDKPVLRIYSYNSFSAPSGPGVVLKEIFEKDCNCRVEFAGGGDAGILLQRLKVEGETLGADLVIGLDQYDLQKALVGLKWQQLNLGALNFADEAKEALANSYFVPYDWGVLTFMGSKNGPAPRRLDDLLTADFEKKILIQDPRTSSPGFQFLYWVIKSKGEEKGLKFLKELFTKVQSITPSWSAAINLFNNSPGSLVYTYVTSPIYYQLAEKKSDFVAWEFEEPLPMQVEFVGIPDFCRNCDLSVKFINLMLSVDGQKILMERNYMLPVLRGVREGTPFADVVLGKKLIDFEIPSESDTEHLLKSWSEIRREP